jgi:hypothetical protein
MNQASDKAAALSEYSDAFKDANGFRPRGILWPDSLTVEQIEAKTLALYRETAAEMAVDAGQADWIDERDRPSMFDDFYGIDLGEDGDGWR